MEIKLGKNIKYLRETKKIDQQTLADKLNIPRSTLACWENNLRTPKLEQIIKIADYFNTDLSIIYEDLQLNTSYKPTEEDFKNILKEKGLMNENGEINNEDFEKLIQLVNHVSSLKINKKKE